MLRRTAICAHNTSCWRCFQQTNFFSKINIQVILDVMRIPITRLCIPIARPILLVAFANGGIKERGVQPFKDLSDFIWFFNIFIFRGVFILFFKRDPL
jgi:hypothetical protein